MRPLTHIRVQRDDSEIIGPLDHVPRIMRSRETDGRVWEPFLVFPEEG